MTQAQPRYVLCDMDGTLIDTEGIKCDAWRLAVRDVLRSVPDGGDPDPAEHTRVYSQLAGAPGVEIGRALVDHYGLNVTGEHLHDLREEHRRRFYKDTDELRARVSKSLVEFIERLRDGFRVLGGGTTVLVTTASEEQVRQVVAATQIDRLFDHIVCGLEKSAENPACYRAALELLEASPADCIAIEDTTNGYAAARALEIPCLLVPNEYTRDQRI